MNSSPTCLGKLEPPGAEQNRDESTHMVKIPDFIKLVLVVVVVGASWGGDCRACEIGRVMGPVHSSGYGIRVGVEILQESGKFSLCRVGRSFTTSSQSFASRNFFFLNL